MQRIAIIGAGITGVTTAYTLVNQGYDVTVFDRHRYAAMETSFANGGQLSASNAEVWTHWSTITKGLRWMLRSDAPLSLNPAPSWHKYSWLAEFLSHIPSYRANTVRTAELAIAARERLFEMARAESIDFDVQTRGILHIYRDRSSFEHAEGVSQLLAQGGLARRAVTPQEMLEIEPTLHGRFYGGFFTPSDCTGDIHKFTRGLSEACVRKGVRMAFDTQVVRLATTSSGIRLWSREDGPADTEQHFDAIVICAGTESRRFAAMLGDRVNIYPVKGYSITVNLDDPKSREAAPWVSLLDDETKIVSSRLGAGRFRVAGTAELNGVNRDIRHQRVRPLVEWTRALFPEVDTANVVPWCGLRPMMPNMMPIVGPGRAPGVYYNTGHGHLGWTLSAATAELLLESLSLEVRPRAQVWRKAS